MKSLKPGKRLLSILLALIALSAVFGTAMPVAAAEINTADLATEVVRLINVERTKAGLPVLESDKTLAAAASLRAREESGFRHLQHKRPDGRPWHTVLNEFGVSCWLRGENLAFGQKTPKEVVRAWMDSPDHRVNILAGYTKIGVGVYNRGDRIYWAQLFINHDGRKVVASQAAAYTATNVFGKPINTLVAFLSRVAGR